MAKKKKSSGPPRKPSLAEMGAHETDVTYRGAKYRLSVSEKMGSDGVIETHMNYDSHAAPLAPKRKANLHHDGKQWWRLDHATGEWKPEKKRK